MKIAARYYRGLHGWTVAIEDWRVDCFPLEESAKKEAERINSILAPFFLRFGSLVREEAAKTCDNPDGSSYLSDAIRSISLPALLEKMGEGV